MAGYGEIYVPVDASTVNGGIMTLGTSGNVSDGSGIGYYWILWNYTVIGDAVEGGYTGISWYWEDPNNYLKTGFNEKMGSSDENDFLNYLKKNQNLNNLDMFLGDWPNDMKGKFMEEHKKDAAFATNCVTYINPNY